MDVDLAKKKLTPRQQLEQRFGRFRYLSSLPSTRPATWGKWILVHNHVNPPYSRACGENGFRAWIDEKKTARVRCYCSWAPELGPHYRVLRPGELAAE